MVKLGKEFCTSFLVIWHCPLRRELQPGAYCSTYQAVCIALLIRRYVPIKLPACIFHKGVLQNASSNLAYQACSKVMCLWNYHSCHEGGSNDELEVWQVDPQCYQLCCWWSSAYVVICITRYKGWGTLGSEIPGLTDVRPDSRAHQVYL